MSINLSTNYGPYLGEENMTVDRINMLIGLIENHEAYFKDYESADEIYILGFSFGDVDMPYVEKIASESPKATIYVSFYDVNSIPEFLNKMMKYIERIKFFKIEGLGSYPPTYVLK